jgi:hypothetical protein
VADTGERLPDFNAPAYDPIKQRALTNILERRLRQINSGIINLDRQVERISSSGNFAPLVHTHVEADITDLQPYLLDITSESIFDLADVQGPGIDGYVLKYSSSTNRFTMQPDISGGGGGSGDRYIGFRDNSGNSTSLTGDEFFRFVSNNTLLEALVIDDDATFGDYLQLTVRNDLIDHDLLTNYDADQHIGHSTVDITAGAGLAGGGDLTATRTLDVGAGEGIAVNADDVALNFSGLTENAISGTDLLAYWNGTNHRQDSWADIQTTISITESQISDLGNYGELDQPEIITANWRAQGDFAFGQNTDITVIDALWFGSEGQFSTAGDAQVSTMVVRYQTTDGITQTLTTDASNPSGTNQIELPNNSSYHVRAEITCKNTGAQESGAWTLEGGADRAATPGSTGIHGFAKTTHHKDDATWDVAAAVDTSAGAVQINVTGSVGKTVRWVARVYITETRH